MLFFRPPPQPPDSTVEDFDDLKLTLNQNCLYVWNFSEIILQTQAR